MPTEFLSVGCTYTISDSNIRGLPAKGCGLFVTATTATSIDLSNASDMSNPKNFAIAGAPFTDPGMACGAGFMRVNGGSAIVRLSGR